MYLGLRAVKLLASSSPISRILQPFVSSWLIAVHFHLLSRTFAFLAEGYFERNECKDRFFRLTFDTRVNKRAVSKQSSANDLCHLCRNGHRSVTRHEPNDANATLYDVFLHRLNILRAKERRQDDGIGHRRRSRPLDNPKLFLGRILDLPTSSRLSPRQLFATARRRVQDNFSGNYARMDERCPRDYVRPRHPLLLLSFFSLDRSEENWVASPDLGQLVRFWNSFSLLVDAFLFALDEARDLCSNASRPWVIFPEYRPVVYRFKQICQPREKEEDFNFFFFF